MGVYCLAESRNEHRDASLSRRTGISDCVLDLLFERRLAMKRCLLVFAAALLGMSFSASAFASAVIVNQTLDLTQAKFAPGPGFQGWQGSPAFDGGFNVAIAEGDSFEFTIDFLGSQTLTVVDLSFIWAFSYADESSSVEAEGTFSFLDANGAAFFTSSLKKTTEGAIHLGQQYNGNDFAGGFPASFTFSGVQYKGTVIDYLDPNVTTRHYNQAALYFTADDAIVGASPVPEPASIAVWGLEHSGWRLFAADAIQPRCCLRMSAYNRGQRASTSTVEALCFCGVQFRWRFAASTICRRSSTILRPESPGTMGEPIATLWTPISNARSQSAIDNPPTT